MNNKPQVILVTGATTGIGEAIASYLHNEGHKVYGTGRKASGLHPKGYTLIPLDINDSDAVNQAVNLILNTENRIDILVNNAGIGMSGAVEEISESLALQIFDTNVLGLHRTCNAVLPQMRKQNYGKISTSTPLHFHMIRNAPHYNLWHG